jgi:hypothetical protein
MGNDENVSRGEITQEVVDTLIELMSEVIGKNAVAVVMNQFPAGDLPPGKDLVFRFAEETEKLLGSAGGYAVLRQVGRDLAKRIASTRPKDQWQAALEQSLNNFGFADRITKFDDHSNICNCVFYPILEERNLEPTAHAVCWAGWGFIEGFMKLMEGVKSIKWVERDMTNKACKFVYQ